MLIWLIFAVMTAAVLATVLRPLFQQPRHLPSTSAFDQAVYRDQLREIDADQERGVISSADADAARIEVSRRLLATDGAPARPIVPEPPTAADTGHRTGFWIAGTLLLFIAVVYAQGGAPGLPGQPFARRTLATDPEQRIDQLVAQVEQRLREHPEEGAGWDVLAPVYLRLERYQDAVDAFNSAIRLLGETPKRLAGLGEALITLNNGMVNASARETFERLLKADPGRPDARFWLAMGKEQDGRKDLAIADYRALLSEAPPGAPWRQAVADRLAGLGVPPPSAPASDPPNEAGARGPSAADVAAAQQMSAEDRQKMITGMVEGLAQRLKREPQDVAGWLKLIRAYAVLGRRDQALVSTREARKHLANDTGALQSIDALAKELGLGS